MDTTSRSFRLPTDLAEAVDAAASARRSTFSEYVSAALRDAVGWTPAAYPPLADAIRDHLDDTWATTGFPVDVTRRVFWFIRDTPAVRELYGSAAKQHTAKYVNQRIGQLVKDHLGARVIGTSTPLPEDELIVTHSLLQPDA